MATVRSLATVAERDDETGNHIQRVHDLGLLLARDVVPDEADDPELAYGFILHDIGKAAVPDAELHGSGHLDEHESEAAKAHPRSAPDPRAPALPGACARGRSGPSSSAGTGSGYPGYGLAGNEIRRGRASSPIVDAIDATDERAASYRRVPLEDVLGEISTVRGTAFDPSCVAGFLALDRGDVLTSAPQLAAEIRLASLCRVHEE